MRANRLFVFAAAFLVAPLSSFAASFTGITAFGDSLTDNGNAYLVSVGLLPGANYGQYTFPGTSVTTKFFSDGPNTTPKAAGPQGLWIDQLAPKLGVSDPLPFFAGGTNYAVGGAQTGTANPQDLGNQLTVFTAGHPGGANSTDLYTLWAGANDLLEGGNPVTAADRIEAAIDTLHGLGATHFLWLNLPLLGDTPRGAPTRDTLNTASAAFNAEWAKDIAALHARGIDVTGVDVGALFARIIADPSAEGFTNVTASAQGQNRTTDAGYLFWDGLHPTTQGHALVANAAFAALNATATPEPASTALVVFGGLALVLKRRFRSRPTR